MSESLDGKHQRENGPNPKKLKIGNSCYEASEEVLKKERGPLGRRIRVGSRKSQLALFQTNFVVELLRKSCPDVIYEIITMSTTGDRILNTPLSKIGEKSLFTKELEVALEKGEVDVVVHSLKDLPTTLPDGMVIGAICRRESPFDAVVCHPDHKTSELSSLKEGSVIGTSSLRRVAQLQRAYPHLKFQSVRGNLNTRLKKLDEGNCYSALILAVAGLTRMDLSHRISSILSPDVCMYAVGQGALAIECRAEDVSTLKLIQNIADEETTLSCIAERSFMRTLEGGCSVPIAVSCTLADGELTLKGGVFSLDGSVSIIDSLSCKLNRNTNENERNGKKQNYSGVVANHLQQHLLNISEDLGKALADLLLQQGAEKILYEARSQNEI